MKDYYYVLGVEFDATIKDIKKAYRKLSLKFHPDQNDSDKFFEDRFKDILEAYETLSNSAKRSLYDTSYAHFFSKKKNERKKPSLPEILKFESNVKNCNINDIIRIEWITKGANKVSLNGVNDNLPIEGFEIIKVSEFAVDGMVNMELFASNENDENVRSKIVIHINKSSENHYNIGTIKEAIRYCINNSYLKVIASILLASMVLSLYKRNKSYQDEVVDYEILESSEKPIAEKNVSNKTYDPFENIQECNLVSSYLKISLQTIFIPSDNIAKHKIKVVNLNNNKTAMFLSESDAQSTYRDWEEKMDFDCYNIKRNIFTEDYNYDGFQDIAVISHMDLGSEAFNFYLQDKNFNFILDENTSAMIKFPQSFEKNDKKVEHVKFIMAGTVKVTNTFEFNEYSRKWEHTGYTEEDY